MKDTYINCEKCGKNMLLKSYRYKHEKTCQGPLESKPIKPKPKAVPIAKPQKVEYNEEEVAHREEEEQYIPPQQQQQNNIIANTPPPRRMQPATASKPATKYSTALPIIAK